MVEKRPRASVKDTSSTALVPLKLRLTRSTRTISGVAAASRTSMFCSREGFGGQSTGSSENCQDRPPGLPQHAVTGGFRQGVTASSMVESGSVAPPAGSAPMATAIASPSAEAAGP